MRTTKIILSIILLFSISFAQAGYSTIIFQKTWFLEGNGTATLDGVFLLNNSDQHVLELNISGGALSKVNGEEIRIVYNGPVNGNKTLSATALIVVNHDTHIIADTPFAVRELQTTSITAYTPEMRKIAWNLKDSNSTLGTIKNMTNWVHSNMVYDISFLGKNIPAKEVFQIRRGVCAEYAHLLLSLFRSIGLESRFVAGYYLHSNGTIEPHGWSAIYIPGNGWVSADATFGEVGFLDARLVAIAFGNDQTDIVDSLQSSGHISMDYKINITEVEAKPYSGIADLFLDFDKEKSELHTTIKNKRNEFIFLTYKLNGPVETGIKREEILLLAPLEEKVLIEKIDHSNMSEGFVYYLPFYASIQGVELEKSFTIVKTKNKGEQPIVNNSQPQPNPSEGKITDCIAGLLLFVIAAFLIKDYVLFSPKNP